MNLNHKLAALVTCLAAACLLAACGSASSSSSSSASGASASSGVGTSTRSKFVACLKQHGVTLPSRSGGFRPPGGGPNGSGAPAGGGNGSGTPPAGGFGGGGGFFGGGGAGFSSRFRNNPKLQAAFKACGGNFPARRRFSPAQRKTEIDNFVKCVRQHGYNLPTPNLSGNGSVFPRSIESNKKFETASRSCASALAPRGGPPAGGQTTTASSTA